MGPSSQLIGEDIVGDPVSHHEVLLHHLQEQLQEDHVSTGTGDRAGGGSLPEAGGRTPELGAVNMCTFITGAGPGLL